MRDAQYLLKDLLANTTTIKSWVPVIADLKHGRDAATALKNLTDMNEHILRCLLHWDFADRHFGLATYTLPSID